MSPEIPISVIQAMATIENWMKSADSDERLELINELMLPYCSECGCLEEGRACQCWNDE